MWDNIEKKCNQESLSGTQKCQQYKQYAMPAIDGLLWFYLIFEYFHFHPYPYQLLRIFDRHTEDDISPTFNCLLPLSVRTNIDCDHNIICTFIYYVKLILSLSGIRCNRKERYQLTYVIFLEHFEETKGVIRNNKVIVTMIPMLLYFFCALYAIENNNKRQTSHHK